MTRRAIAYGFVVVALSATVNTQTQSGSSIVGVWKVAEREVIGGQNPGTNKSPQPGFFFFTARHYSIMFLGGAEPRANVEDQQITTDAQKLALYEHWAPLTANAGTYTVKGTTLTTRPLVAKNQGVMQGNEAVREFKLEGNTLVLIQKPPAGQTGAEVRIRLTRVE
jgi:hypothetical protein